MCLILMYLLILVSQNPVVKVGIFIKFSKVSISLLSRFRIIGKTKSTASQNEKYKKCRLISVYVKFKRHSFLV